MIAQPAKPNFECIEYEINQIIQLGENKQSTVRKSNQSGVALPPALAFLRGNRVAMEEDLFTRQGVGADGWNSHVLWAPDHKKVSPAIPLHPCMHAVLSLIALCAAGLFAGLLQ